jgi:hypothetical protein
MKRPGKFALTVMSAGVCMMLTGCFSYSKESTSRTTPSVVEVPQESSSSTTTTTTESNPVKVERQRTTTYTNP